MPSNQHPAFLEREDCTPVAWYLSLDAPRAGGAYDSHHRTAGIAGRTRRRGRMAARGARDQREAASPVVPVAGEKPRTRPITAHQHSEAVVFDFVQPPGPSGGFLGWAGQAGFTEVGEGYAT